jgi:hypothetical protein
MADGRWPTLSDAASRSLMNESGKNIKEQRLPTTEASVLSGEFQMKVGHQPSANGHRSNLVQQLSSESSQINTFAALI